MIGFKAFMEDLTCRGYQYEIGKTFTADGEIELCGNGFHFCKQPGQVFSYYDKDARLCEVEADGEIIEGDDKCVCSKLTVLREIIGVDRNRIIYGNGYGYGNGDGYGYGYGNGDGNGNGYGYGNGNGYGDGDGYGYGYGNGNGYGYGDGKTINNILTFKED